MSRTIGALVLDTNIVLDLLLFDDPATRNLKQLLVGGALDWLATPAMRDEIERVLAYRRIGARVVLLGKTNTDLLAQYDALSQCRPAAPPAAVRCRDRDDQMFIDLAVAHRAMLLSKDDGLLRLLRRLAVLGVAVQKAL